MITELNGPTGFIPLYKQLQPGIHQPPLSFPYKHCYNFLKPNPDKWCLLLSERGNDYTISVETNAYVMELM